jgi:anti-sigma regulatory factor (Ser/Thr protein kinase)
MEHSIFQATFGSTVETAQKILCEALGTIERHGWIHGQEDRFAFWLCIEEALCNAVHHGNRDNPELKVGLELFEDGLTGRVAVRDEGEGFDPELLEMPCPEALTGRGVCLIRHFARRVWYDRASRSLMFEFSLKSAAGEPKGE